MVIHYKPFYLSSFSSFFISVYSLIDIRTHNFKYFTDEFSNQPITCTDHFLFIIAGVIDRFIIPLLS